MPSTNATTAQLHALPTPRPGLNELLDELYPSPPPNLYPSNDVRVPALLTNRFGGGRPHAIPHDVDAQVRRDRLEALRRLVALEDELRRQITAEREAGVSGYRCDWRSREELWHKRTQLKRYLEDFAGLAEYATHPRYDEDELMQLPLPCSRCGHQEA
jgi:hypothetical protein